MSTASGGGSTSGGSGSGAGRRRPRRLLFGVIVALSALVLALVAVVVFFGPSIAGRLAPGIVADAAKSRIAGSVSVDQVKLSWSGPQTIRGLKVHDPSGGLIADLSIEASAGLTSLARGSYEVGTIKVAGSINVEKHGADSSVKRALAPAPGAPGRAPTAAGAPSGGPSRLPASLAARVVIDGLNVTFTDKTPAAPGDAALVRSASIPKLTGEASFAVGQPLVVKLQGDGAVDGEATGIHVDATVNNLTDASGLITLESITVDAKADAALPSALLAALPAPARLAPLLRDAFAPAVAPASAKPSGITTVRMTAKGDAKAIDAMIDARAPGASLAGAVSVTGLGGAGGAPGRVRTTTPLVAQFGIGPETVAALLARGANAPSPVVLGAPVRSTATITIDAPLPSGALDLRGGAARIELQTTDARGALTLPGDDAPSPFVLAPLRAVFDAPDLAGPVTLKIESSATLRGENAGALALDVRAAGLLDEKGAPRTGLPKELIGTARITGMATALAQPFVKNDAIDLRRDAGPTIDLVATATTRPDQPEATDLALRLRSANLSADAALAYDGKTLTAVSEGVSVSMKNPAPALSAMLKDAGVALASSAPINLAIPSLEAPISGGGGGGGVDLSKMRAAGRLSVGAVRATIGQDPNPIALSAMNVDLALEPGAPARVVVKGDGAYGAEPFGIGADIRLAGLLDAKGAITPAAVRPIGTVRITDAPVSLATLAGLGEHMDLIREAVGPSMTIDLDAKEGAGSASDVVASAKGANLDARATLTLTKDKAELKGAEANTTLTPALLSAALRQFAPEMQSPPRLTAPASLAVRVEPMTIPLVAGKPDLQKSSPVRAALALGSDGARLSGVEVNGRPAEFALKALTASATWSLADTGPREGAIKGELLDASGAGRVAAFDAGATLTGGSVREARLNLTDLNTERVDALLGKPGLLAGALGSPATIAATVSPKGAPGRATTASNAKSGAQALAIRAEVKSPRLTTSASFDADEDTIALTAPVDAKWTLEPAWAAANLFKPEPGRPASIALTRPAELAARLERLTISRAPGAPLKPGVFALDARITSPALDLSASGTPMSLRGVAAAARTDAAQAGVVTFDASINQVDSGPASPGAPRATGGNTMVSGKVGGFADARGAPTPEAAILTLDADGRLPSALVDALANQHGGLVELLGPTVDVKVAARALSRAGGTLSADATAPRADAHLKGAVRLGVFEASEPVTARVHEMTPEFAKRAFEPIMPMLSNLEKKREDGPATVTLTSLQAPIAPEIDTDGDGKPDSPDLRKLNGDMRLELGRARYAANDAFGQILKATKNRTEGRLFSNFPPVNVAIRNGVASYERTAFPIGEFTIETRGKVDLAAKTMDLIVYVPILAVADEVIGALKLAPGLDQLTMIPFRMKGPFGNAPPVPAPDLIAKEFFESPESILKGAGSILEGILKNKKK